MKNQLLIVALVFIPIIMLGQNKYSTGLNVNSEWSFMSFENSNAPNGIEESGLGFGYSIGLQTQYELNEKLFLRTGLNYQFMKYRDKIEGLRFGTNSDGTTSSIHSDITVSSLGIPLNLGYRLTSKNEKISYIIGIGGILNLNLNTESNSVILHQNMENEQLVDIGGEIEEALFSIDFFGGVEYKLSEKLILGIEPNIRFTPNNYKLYLYGSLGKIVMETGLTVRLRM